MYTVPICTVPAQVVYSLRVAFRFFFFFFGEGPGEPGGFVRSELNLLIT